MIQFYNFNMIVNYHIDTNLKLAMSDMIFPITYSNYLSRPLAFRLVDKILILIIILDRFIVNKNKGRIKKLFYAYPLW